MRDMILFGRVTDWERCRDDCPGRDIRHGLCCGYWPDEQVEERWSEEKAKRCPSCLAAPSAVVLTAEMLEAVKSAVSMCAKYEDENGHYHRFVSDALRAAFISASRNALPHLLAYIEKLEAVASAARGAFDKYEYSFPPATFDDVRDRLNDLDVLDDE